MHLRALLCLVSLSCACNPNDTAPGSASGAGPQGGSTTTTNNTGGAPDAGTGGTSTGGTTTTQPPCAAAPGTYSVEDWTSFANSATVMIRTIEPGSGLSFRFTMSIDQYPYGWKASDAAGGQKDYSISRCPGGTDGPVDGQDGTTSVNGDPYLDNCAAVPGSYMRNVDTSGASPVYYDNAANLAAQQTCFLPATTGLGESTPATYYMNIFNPGSETVSIQYKNLKQLK